MKKYLLSGKRGAVLALSVSLQALFQISAASAQVLSSDGLVVRYYMDEAASGQAPTHLLDSAGSPLNLPLYYSSNMSYESRASGNGLSWNVQRSSGYANIPLDGTKFKSALQDSPEFTVEVVLDVQSGDGPSRVLATDWGRGDHGEIAIVYEQSTTTLSVEVHDRPVRYVIDLSVLGRRVLHAVMDSNESIEADRIRLYIDGVLQTPAASQPYPALGNTLHFGTERYLVIGNSSYNARSLDGSIFYTAVYNRALDSVTINNHVSVLLANDDTP